MYKLALVQMLVEGGDKKKNLAHAKEMIREAARAGARLIVLPETMNCGWTHPSTAVDADEVPEGETCRMLRDAAREHAVYVCSGLAERADDGVYNSAVLAAPNGTAVLMHRKLNELDIGHDYYGQGDRLNVCHTGLGTIGLFICADATAKELVLGKALGYMGAEIIISPCAWAVDADHDNAKDPYGDMWRDAYAAVAEQFALWVVGVSNVGAVTAGPWAGRKCIGCSIVVDHRGTEVLRGPYGADAETILYVDANTVQRPARGSGWYSFPKKE
jgi:predicted amidohydrolase